MGAILIAILLGGALAACSRDDATKPSPSAPMKVSLRLKWVFDAGFAGEMVAAKAGYFNQQGLDVTIRPGGFEADPIKLVASGADTFGVTGADSFLLARRRGVPIIAFAAGYLDTPVVFYVKTASGIVSPADFIGKRVGYQAGQDTATVYEQLLKQTNVDRSKIKEVPVKFDFGLFLHGEVDVWPGYAATQSFLLDRERVPYRMIAPSQFGLHQLGTVYFTSEKFAREHPEAVQAFVDGLIRGWERTYESYQEVIPLIASFDEKALTADVVQFTLDKQKASIRPPGSRYCEFALAQWNSLQATLVAEKLLDEPVDLQRAVTTTYLEKHYQRVPAAH